MFYGYDEPDTKPADESNGGSFDVADDATGRTTLPWLLRLNRVSLAVLSVLAVLAVPLVYFHT